MQPFVFFEFVQQSEYIRNRQFAFAAVDQLNCLAALQIDAGNQHGKRTSISLAGEKILQLANRLRVIVKNRSCQCGVGADLREKSPQNVRGNLRRPKRSPERKRVSEIAAVRGMSKPL